MNSERIGHLLFALAVVFLAYLGGALSMLGEVYPHEPLRNAYRAALALTARQQYDDPLKTDLWRTARSDRRGVTVHAPARVAPGYTLYTSGDGPHALLITLDGAVVHTWKRPYSTVWDATAAVRKPRPDPFIYMDKARVLPNGDLLAIYTAAGDTPWGYGMVKLDRDSRVLWRYLAQAHHDFDFTPDGRIVLLTHALTSQRLEGYHNLDQPRLDDYVVVLAPDGRELKKVSLTLALARSRYNALLHATPRFSREDPLHTNTVTVITAATGAQFPHGEEGQVLLSFRDMGALAVLDVEREEIVWATRGPWVGQHNPTLLPGGRLLLFDNMGGFRAGNASRVLEIDARTLGVVWKYEGDEGAPFDSPLRSSAQRLGNGNTLITESDGGRLLEVTAEGTVVWEYVNPVRQGARGGLIPVVSSGHRVAPEMLDADFRRTLEAAH